MLVRFSFENWKSFRDRVTISAIAGKQRLNNEHMARVDNYGFGILPVLAIYGANASGKSNVFQALAFVRQLVTRGQRASEEIDIDPFRLCADSNIRPCSFTIEFLATDDCIYELSFSVTKDMVCDERLIKIRTTTEQVLYERKGEDIKIFSGSERTQLEFIAKGTRKNQLFLTNTIEQNSGEYKAAHDWFRVGLMLVAPDTKYSSLQELVDKDSPLYNNVNALLRELDTGILHLGTRDYKEAADLEKIPDKLAYYRVLEILTKERYVNSQNDGKEAVKTLVSYHACDDGKEVEFEFSRESDGSKRLIDLLPAFLPKKPAQLGVFVIDELDRSLHHLLVRNLLERFIQSCTSQTRAQLLFTTHDLLLMNQELLRRDEMFVVERSSSGVSTIIPLNEYAGIRSDKDILKSYLQGRFGGIPRL